MLSHNDFISVDEMIAGIVESISDDEFKFNGKSYYLGLVHRAIEQLAIQSYYQTVTRDIFDWNCNGNLMFDIPANAFNLKELVFFNLAHKPGCSCTDTLSSKECWADFRVAHYKSHYNSFGSTEVRTAKIADGVSNFDPVYRTIPYINGLPGYTKRTDFIYFGIQNGSYTMSNQAEPYANARLVYSGMGSDNDKLPCIPRIFRDAITDWAAERASSRLKIDYPKFATAHNDALRRLNGTNPIQNPGSWILAKRLAKRSDKKILNDYQEYTANPDAK